MDSKQNRSIIEKMVTYQNELISENHNFNEDTLSEWVLEACEFAFDNFKEEDYFYDGYNYKFEVRVSTIGMRLMSGLKRIYPHLKMSEQVIHTICTILDTDKYANGRDGFILALWENKLDTIFIITIQKHKEFWESPRITFDMVWGLTRRRIAGFSPQVKLAIEQFKDKKSYTDIIKKCQKYLEDEPKYKHFSVFLERDGSRRKKP